MGTINEDNLNEVKSILLANYSSSGKSLILHFIIISKDT